MNISAKQRRKDLFGDCALVEIIHLHDCLRGALNALEKDVNELSQIILKGGFREKNQQSNKLERKVASRFKVIWSVFKAHSSAEDEFIWPALQSKTQGKVTHHHAPQKNVQTVEQEEYEEDHADEERMFSKMDDLLTKLRNGLLRQRLVLSNNESVEDSEGVDKIMKEIQELTKKLSQHLMEHLEKEEKQCMPLVAKHLSKSEIHDLVGKIMGRRSADMIAQIMTMAVQNLDVADREEMVTYMKQAMAGTFFDRWLSMSGWMDDGKDIKRKRQAILPENTSDSQKKSKPNDSSAEIIVNATAVPINPSVTIPQSTLPAARVTSQTELEKLIRVIATNPNLSPQQKNTTIQGLRDSVWKSNQQIKSNSEVAMFTPRTFSHNGSAAVSATCTPARRVTPPSIYYKKNKDGKIDVVWNSDEPALRSSDAEAVPLFSASELAPTHHDGATGAVLGCPHYARACKLRHPVSGRLYTCRLCCEQELEMPSKDKDEPLDRYAVNEIMCMKCNTLQPADDRCLNSNCESGGKVFAKYFCRICNLYDDRPRPIFHCPYCNTCRMGLGLGIDFRHCMRCNACVSLTDTNHKCIPQKLQGSCPICHESLFQSTEPLKGLKCGHVMHLSCFTDYRRGHCYTCPLCMRSMEDMSDYFALLDAAVRMQPMPAAYLKTVSNVYCQDCEKTSQCKYHFVGAKCAHCGSYNTRELGRVQRSDSIGT